jgi:hypothetical protein
MMGVLRWPEGQGWLIFASRPEESGSVRTEALTHVIIPGATVCIAPDSGEAEAILADLAELGAPSGYVVDLADEAPEIAIQSIQDAGLVVISAETPDQTVRLLNNRVLEAVLEVFGRGAVVLIEGAAVPAFGQWYLAEENMMADGFALVANTVLATDAVSAREAPFVQAVMLSQPDTLGIIIGPDSGLALGPERQLKALGRQFVTVALGQAYRDGTLAADA